MPSLSQKYIRQTRHHEVSVIHVKLHSYLVSAEQCLYDLTNYVVQTTQTLQIQPGQPQRLNAVLQIVL